MADSVHYSVAGLLSLCLQMRIGWLLLHVQVARISPIDRQVFHISGIYQHVLRVLSICNRVRFSDVVCSCGS